MADKDLEKVLQNMTEASIASALIFVIKAIRKDKATTSEDEDWIEEEDEEIYKMLYGEVPSIDQATHERMYAEFRAQMAESEKQSASKSKATKTPVSTEITRVASSANTPVKYQESFSKDLQIMTAVGGGVGGLIALLLNEETRPKVLALFRDLGSIAAAAASIIENSKD